MAHHRDRAPGVDVALATERASSRPWRDQRIICAPPSTAKGTACPRLVATQSCRFGRGQCWYSHDYDVVSAAIHQDKSGESVIEEEKQRMSAAGTEEKCFQVLGRKGRRGGKGRGKGGKSGKDSRGAEKEQEEPRPREKVSLKERTPQRKEKVSLRERSPQRKEKEEEEPVLREKVSLKEGAHMKVVNKGYGIDCAAGKPQSSSRSAAAETGGQGEAQIFGEEVKSLFSLVVLTVGVEGLI